MSIKNTNLLEFPLYYGPKWGMVVNAIVAALGIALIVVLYIENV
jgi:hypothetical protein